MRKLKRDVSLPRKQKSFQNLIVFDENKVRDLILNYAKSQGYNCNQEHLKEILKIINPYKLE